MTTDPTPASPTRPGVPHRGLTTALALVAPILVLAGAAGVAWSWRTELPDPVATHWGPGGGPDGFSSLSSSLVTMVAIGALLSLMFWAIGFWWGQQASSRRIAAGASLGMSVFVSTLVVGSTRMQRGLTDAAEAGGIGHIVALATLGALVVGAAAAVGVPGDRATPATTEVPPDAARTPLGADERAVWVSTTKGGPGIWIGASAILVTGTLAVVTREWWMLLFPVLLLALFAGMLVWNVRVDARGIDVRSALGWPKTFVAAASIEGATAREVSPFGEFGGFGWRTGRGGALGIVVRRGPGIEVTHSGGKRLVVTVDDADVGAALLNTVAERAR